METCAYCDRPAWYRDRETGELLCPEHARLEVRGPRPERTGAESGMLKIRPSTPDDEANILELWLHFWDDHEMDCFGKTYRATDLPALLACDGDRVVGLLSYAVERRWKAINIVALHVLPADQGQGEAAALVRVLEEQARRMGMGRLIVATSNDNVLALYFYQRLGFEISAIKVGQVAPDDPEQRFIGVGRIPVRDEVQLEKRLQK
jgi:ribosomal protein S18 acetylase RimI-like enzyme